MVSREALRKGEVKGETGVGVAQVRAVSGSGLSRIQANT